jgi:hypothetical protein
MLWYQRFSPKACSQLYTPIIEHYLTEYGEEYKVGELLRYMLTIEVVKTKLELEIRNETAYSIQNYSGEQRFYSSDSI